MGPWVGPWGETMGWEHGVRRWGGTLRWDHEVGHWGETYYIPKGDTILGHNIKDTHSTTSFASLFLLV